MDIDTILGLVIIASGLIFITLLVLWSRKIIEMIARKRPQSVRDILKEIRSDK